MEDYVIRATAGDGAIRAFAAATTGLVEEARKRHGTLPTASAALGRVLTAAAMMGITLKGEDTLTLRIVGDGPLGAVVAVADASGAVRGYVQEPLIHLPSKAARKLDVGSAVGKNGMVYVTKDLGLKEPYTGSVPLVSGEIAEDLSYYFTVSEQIPTAVALGVIIETDNSVRAAGGFMVQLLPGAEEGTVQKLEENIQAMPPVSQLVDEGLSPEEILNKVLKGFEVTVHEKLPLKFYCGCSRERLEKILISLGKEELKSMLREQGQAELTCHFCADRYHFTKEDLERLLEEIK